MKVTDKDVAAVADLAHLELTAEERARMLRDLNSILGHIDTLNQLDTAEVPPMAQSAGRFAAAGGALPSSLREDRAGPSLPRDLALANAPASDGLFFKVPKVIER